VHETIAVIATITEQMCHDTLMFLTCLFVQVMYYTQTSSSGDLCTTNCRILCS